MAIFRIGPGSKGYNTLAEFLDMDCIVTLPASGTLFQGESVWYDQTKISPIPPTVPTSTSVGDACLVAPAANALRIYGVYQGPTIVNPSSTVTLAVNVLVRKIGYGVILGQTTAAGTGSSAVNVGSQMIAAPNTAGLFGNYAGAFVLGTTVGYALATGAVTAPGAQLMAAATAATLLLNAYIQVM